MVFFQNCGAGFKTYDYSSKSEDLDNLLSNPNLPLSVFVRDIEVRQGYDPIFKIEIN